MARTKGFDPDAALERALEVFWRQGYEATSTQTLVEELGLSRSSLYGTFHSKGELYRRALHCYADRSERELRDALAGPGPLKSKLRDALLGMVEEDLDPTRTSGCFAGNSAVELAPSDPAVRAITRQTFERIRRILADALEAAAERGELRADLDPRALASGILVAMQGLRVVAKGSGDRRLLEQSVDQTLAQL